MEAEGKRGKRVRVVTRQEKMAGNTEGDDDGGWRGKKEGGG